MASTHFAVIDNGIVIGTRSSASRHVDGQGKFGPYTHAVVASYTTTFLDPNTPQKRDQAVISWHGTAGAALSASGAKFIYTKYNVDAQGGYIGSWDKKTPVGGVQETVRVQVLPVVITAKKATIGGAL